MDLHEEEFRKDFEKTALKMGWSSYHVSSPDGIHDELMFQNDIGITLELKALSEKKIGHSVHSHFKPTQMPFYLRQISDSKTPTYIAIKVLTEPPTYIFYKLDSTKKIIDFFASKWKDLIPGPHPIIYHETALIAHINGVLKGFL